MEIQNPAKLRISPGKGASDDLGKVATASRMQLGLHLGRNFTVDVKLHGRSPSTYGFEASSASDDCISGATSQLIPGGVLI